MSAGAFGEPPHKAGEDMTRVLTYREEPDPFQRVFIIFFFFGKDSLLLLNNLLDA